MNLIEKAAKIEEKIVKNGKPLNLKWVEKLRRTTSKLKCSGRNNRGIIEDKSRNRREAK